MSKIVLSNETGTVSTPSSGKWGVFTRADGLYIKDSLGTEARLSTGSSGGASDHESLTGLLGGTSDNHWHLAPSQVVGLVSGTFTNLHFHTGTIFVQDEGGTKQVVGTINFVGNNVDVSVSGTVARVFVTGSAGGTGGDLYNYIDNPGFDLTQHILTTASSASMTDGGYDMFDRWYSLIQGSGATLAQGNAVGASRWSLKMTAGGTTNRYGQAQIFSAEKSISLRGKTGIFQIKIKPNNNAGSGSRDYRVAILEWTGTVNSPVKDVVNDWTSSNFTTGNFFKSATTTLVGTAQETITHNTEAIISVSGAVSASCNHIIVFVWVEDVPTHASDYAELAEAGYYVSTSEQTWQPKHGDFDECLLYFERITTGTQYGFFGTASVYTATVGRSVIPMHRKWTTPSLSSSAASTFMVQDALGGNYAGTSISLSYPSDVGFLLDVTTGGTMSVGAGFIIDNGTDAVFGTMYVNADLGV